MEKSATRGLFLTNTVYMTALTAPPQLSFSIKEVICICDAWVRFKCKKREKTEAKM